MRLLVVILLLANLGYFGWSRWIAAEPAGVVPDSLTSAVPSLKLAQELDPGATPRGGGAAAPTGIAASAGPAATWQCITLGPYAADDAAQQAAVALRAKGFDALERPTHTEVADGWWVFIPAIESAAAEGSIVRQLQENGMADAQEMPPSAAGLRISVGVFSDRERAARRAAAVSRLGLRPQVGEHTHAATTYWLDVRVRSGGQGLRPGDVEALNQGGASVNLAPCVGRAAVVATDAPPA